MRVGVFVLIGATMMSQMACNAQGGRRMTAEEIITAVIENAPPLEFERGERLPIRASRLEGWLPEEDAEALEVLGKLDERGLALNAQWNPNPNRVEGSLAFGLRLGRLQKQLGLGVGINANACMHSFFDGEERTFHVAEDGTTFIDESFPGRRQMGCPFALAHRYEAIKQQFIPFLGAYQEAGLEVEYLYLDWEIDGPIEWNAAWENSKKCTRCREHVPNIEDFTEFQKVLRTLRAEMQKECCAEVVLQYFPEALVGNYGEYPGDGYRYWYDYFEDHDLPEGVPFRADQRAKYRQWPDVWRLTGYTFAMPVVYTWYATYGWYDFANEDYRWFYNMLKVASNAGQHTPQEVPIITWMHWHTTAPPADAPEVPQLSEEMYRELLWHILLRGTDAFSMWCTAEETVKEIQLLQGVYGAALEHEDFLDNGIPILFDVPPQPGPVVSALRLGNRLLVRRTDFDERPEAVTVTVDGVEIEVPRAEGECQVIEVR